MYIPILITLLLAPTIQADFTYGTVSRTLSVEAYSPAVPRMIDTVTIIGVDATATTFMYDCQTIDDLGSQWRFLVPTGLWDSTATFPTPTPSTITAEFFECTNYQYTQGPSTWAMSFSQHNISFSGTCKKDHGLDSCTSSMAYTSSNYIGKEEGSDQSDRSKKNRTVLATVTSDCKSKRGHRGRFELNNAYHAYCQ